MRAALVGSNYIIACGYIKPGSGIADACLPADRRFWTVSHRAIGRMDACVIGAPEPVFFYSAASVASRQRCGGVIHISALTCAAAFNGHFGGI